MRLTELEPRFLQYLDDRARLHDGVTLATAQGLLFLCPTCWIKNGGPVGTHAIEVTFKDRGVPAELGSHGRGGDPSRWEVSGTGFDDLTLSPSIDITPGCTWHGFIQNGAVIL